jgi:hypothetical protein
MQQLGRHDPGEILRQLQGLLRVVLEQIAELAHRRDGLEPLAKALHPPALVIDRNHQAGIAKGMDFAAQLGQLPRIAVVTAEQDDPAGLRMAQAAPIVIVERQALDVQHDRSQRHISIAPAGRRRPPRYPLRDR